MLVVEFWEFLKGAAHVLSKAPPIFFEKWHRMTFPLAFHGFSDSGFSRGEDWQI